MSDRDELVAQLRGWDHCWPTRWLETAVADAADQIERDGREIERLRAVLVRMVEELACDDPECDICAPARAALNPEGETTSGSSKWGPQFPPASCTAYEDCAHDGVCHDPNCGAPSQHGKGEA